MKFRATLRIGFGGVLIFEFNTEPWWLVTNDGRHYTLFGASLADLDRGIKRLDLIVWPFAFFAGWSRTCEADDTALEFQVNQR